MQKVKTFFDNFVKSSFPQAPYYHRLTRTHLRGSVFYFLQLVAVLSVIAVIHFTIFVNPPQIKKFLHAVDAGLSDFPPTTIMEIRNGNLNSSMTMPYFLWTTIDDKLHLLLVVDRNAAPTMTDKYETTFLINQKDVIYRPFPKHSPIMIPLSHFHNQVIDSQFIQDVRTKLSLLEPKVTYYYLLCIVLVAALTFLGSLATISLYIIVASVITYLLFTYVFHGRFGHHLSRLRFDQVLKIAIHAATLPLILDYILVITPPLFLFLLVMFVCGGVYEAYLDDNFK